MSGCALPLLGVVTLLIATSVAIGGPLTTTIACERARTTTSISCTSPKQIIEIQSATWGRTNLTLCLEHGIAKKTTTNCSVDKTSKLVALCDGRSSCKLPQDIQTLQDPCVQIDKYLTVQWSCEPTVPSSMFLSVSPQGLLAPGTPVTFAGNVSVKETNQSLTGSVQLVENGKVLTSVTIPADTKGSYVFSISYNRFSKGTHTVSITYTGEGDVEAVSLGASVAIDGRSKVELTLRANKNKLTAKKVWVNNTLHTITTKPLVLSGRVIAADGSIPKGGVSLFQSTSGKKKKYIGGAVITAQTGKFVFIIHRLSPGNRTYTVHLAGSKKYFKGSSNSVTVQVVADPNEPDPPNPNQPSPPPTQAPTPAPTTPAPTKINKKIVLQVLDLIEAPTPKSSTMPPKHVPKKPVAEKPVSKKAKARRNKRKHKRTKRRKNLKKLTKKQKIAHKNMDLN